MLENPRSYWRRFPKLHSLHEKLLLLFMVPNVLLPTEACQVRPYAKQVVETRKCVENASERKYSELVVRLIIHSHISNGGIQYLPYHTGKLRQVHVHKYNYCQHPRRAHSLFKIHQNRLSKNIVYSTVLFHLKLIH